MAHVTAQIVDENTLSVDGVLFVREREEEALLRPIYPPGTPLGTLTPDLQCSSCGYSASYFNWYHRTDFKERYVRHCPGCGLKIFAVVGRSA